MLDPFGVWERTGWYVVPNTAQELMAAIGAIGVFSKRQKFAWRGHSDIDYPVTSSIHRRFGIDQNEDAIRAREQSLLRDARDWGLGIGETAFVDDLQLLADLQHYGIETRLVDVTSNPMTALWFACQRPRLPDGTSHDRRGVLLAINVTDMSRYKTVGAVEALSWSEVDAPYSAALSRALQSGEPFVVESSKPNDRLRAQEGYFVASTVPDLSATDRAATPFWSLALDYEPGNPLGVKQVLAERSRFGHTPVMLPFVAVIVRRHLKPQMLGYLESSYSRHAGVIFPDYAGFAEYKAHGGRGGDPGKVAGRS
jgi:hypothetical protein